MGRRDERRRVVCGLAVVLQVRVRGPCADAVPAHHPHAPGPRRGGDPLLDRGRAGPDHPVEHALRHDARQHRSDRRRGCGPRDSRGIRNRRAAPVQRQHRSCEAGTAAGRVGRPSSARHADGHEQCGWWPASEPGEHTRDRGDRAPPRQDAIHRRVPFCRERMVHQESRARAGRASCRGHRARHVRSSRRHDHEREEGCVRQHRRLARDERRHAGSSSSKPADPDRGIPDLWRTRRARSRGDCGGPRGDRRRAVPALPGPHQ